MINFNQLDTTSKNAISLPARTGTYKGIWRMVWLPCLPEVINNTYNLHDLCAFHHWIWGKNKPTSLLRHIILKDIWHVYHHSVIPANKTFVLLLHRKGISVKLFKVIQSANVKVEDKPIKPLHHSFPIHKLKTKSENKIQRYYLLLKKLFKAVILSTIGKLEEL